MKKRQHPHSGAEEGLKEVADETVAVVEAEAEAEVEAEVPSSADMDGAVDADSEAVEVPYKHKVDNRADTVHGYVVEVLDISGMNLLQFWSAYLIQPYRRSPPERQVPLLPSSVDPWMGRRSSLMAMVVGC